MKLAILVGLAGLGFGAANAAAIQDIRIARHPDHIRVVLDLDAPVSFTASGDNSYVLHGLADGSAVMNAEPRDAPLSRVVLTPDGHDAKLSFEASTKLRAQAFSLAPNSSGGHRIVVDLYPEQAAPTSLAATLPASAAAAPPASGAVAAPPAPVTVPPPNSYAAVPPSMPPQTAVEPTPIAPADASAAAPAPPVPAAPIVATAAPTNIAPPGAAVAPPATSPIAPPVTQPPQTPAAAEDRAVFAERALDRGDAPAACRLADETLRVEPQNLRALVVLGGCRLALGEALAARAAFATALEGDPSYHRALIGLAQSEAKLGNIAGARADYARALADNPPTDEAYRIIGAIDALNSGATSLAPLSRQGS